MKFLKEPKLKLTRSIDGRMRMTIQVDQRLTPVQFVEYIADYLHSCVEENAPGTRKACDLIVRAALRQQGNEQVLDYNDDDYFSALAIVQKAFPEFGLQLDDTAEKEMKEIQANYERGKR